MRRLLLVVLTSAGSVQAYHGVAGVGAAVRKRAAWTDLHEEAQEQGADGPEHGRLAVSAAVLC